MSHAPKGGCYVFDVTDEKFYAGGQFLPDSLPSNVKKNRKKAKKTISSFIPKGMTVAAINVFESSSEIWIQCEDETSAQNVKIPTRLSTSDLLEFAVDAGIVFQCNVILT